MRMENNLDGQNEKCRVLLLKPARDTAVAVLIKYAQPVGLIL